MTYSDRIENLSTIRVYARSFCVEGFKDRKGKYKEKKSPESYNNARRRMENWFQGEAFTSVFDEQRKRFHIQLDARNYNHNPLNAVFRAKTFTNKSIFLRFTALDVLSDGKPHRCADLISDIQNCWQHYDAGLSLTIDVIRKQLKEFESLGILKSSKSGRDVYYSLSSDKLDRESWRDALAFYSEAGTLSIVGSYLTDVLPCASELFTFKHHYMHHILDSEVLLAAVEAIAAGRRIRTTFYRVENDQERCFTWTLSPIEVRMSAGTGRRWLISLKQDDARKWHYEAIRLDDIVSIGLEKDPVNPKVVKHYRQWLNAHLWGVTCRELDKIVTVEMLIRTTPEDMQVLARLEREKRCGSVTKVDKLTRLFRAEVCSAEEMAPWLMSFTGYIVSLTSSDKSFEHKFWEEVRNLRALYT